MMEDDGGDGSSRGSGKKLARAEVEPVLAILLKDKGAQHQHVLVSHCKINLVREKAFSPFLFPLLFTIKLL